MWQTLTKVRKLDNLEDVWAIMLVQSAVFFIKTIVYAAHCALWSGGLVGVDSKPFGHDFIAFWAASRLLKQGDIAGIYSVPAFSGTLAHLFGQPLSLYWWYPPHFLFLIWPLTFIYSYKTAYIAWSAFTAAALAIAMFWRTSLGRNWRWLVFFSPGFYVCLDTGQNGLLFAALLAGGFRLLKPAPWISGIVFGLLILKPQFGILIPFVLLALREYRPLAGMILTSAALVLASAAAFGMQSWQDYFHTLMLYQAQFLSLASAKMISVHAAVASLGGPAPLAAGLQMAIALLVVVLLCLKLRRMRGASWQEILLLVAPAIYLVTPYVFPYDACLLSVAWLFWLAERERAGGKIAAFHTLLWLLAWYVPMLYDPRVIREGLSVLAPVLFLLIFAVSLRPSRPTAAMPV